MTKAHSFDNPGGKEMPPDRRDFRLLGGAVEIPKVYTNERAWSLPISYQKKQPACGAHAGAFLSMLLDERVSQNYTPRFNWIDIKTFDGYPIADGTDMRSIFKSLQNGTLDFDKLGNDTDLSLVDYASPKAVTDTMRKQAKENGIEAYAFAGFLTFQELKALVYQHGAVILLFRVGEEFWTKKGGQTSWQEKDIMPLRPPKTIISGHFVVAHSYDEKYVYFANSFSKDWGRKGHGYFGANYLPFINQVGTAVDKPAPVVEVPYTFTRDLFFGLSGDDVKELQKYLNQQGFRVALFGAGSPGNESDYFGRLTQNALIKFQKAKGISPTSGYFGPITRGIINNV